MEATRDAILYGLLHIWQPLKGPRVSVDSVLLAWYARIKRGERAIELGSAHGAVSLILARRYPECSIEGIEIQEELVELARLNAAENGLTDRVSFYCRDLRQVQRFYRNQSFHVAVANPPYGEVLSSRASPVWSEAVARGGLLCSLDDVARSASYLLRHGGRLYMVYSARRLSSLMMALKGHGLEPKRLRAVHPKPEREASVVLLEARMKGGEGLTVEPPLYIYDECGKYTKALLSAYSLEGQASCRS
jgi:tRNA1Val (adenine37-N6)-methyltransferase